MKKGSIAAAIIVGFTTGLVVITKYLLNPRKNKTPDNMNDIIAGDDYYT